MGTISVIKHRSGPSYRLNKPGTEHTLDEIYKVTWIPTVTSGTIEIYIGDEELIRQASTMTGGVPQVQSRMPGCGVNFRHWIVDSVEWRPNTEAPFSFTANVRYYNMLPYQYGTTPATEPWVRVTRNVQTRQAMIYRKGLTSAPYQASYAWPPTTDIGGTSVDINGTSIVQLIPQVQFTIEWLWHRGYQTAAPTPTGTPAAVVEPPSWIAEDAGKRNTATFFGFDKESVLFQGYSASPLNDQTYLMQYRFLWDQWRFYEQKAAPAFNNLPNLTAPTGSFIGIPYKKAANIGWYQPYTDLVNFTQDFPPEVYNAIATTYPAQNSCP
jgi:hypothetical protein